MTTAEYELAREYEAKCACPPEGLWSVFGAWIPGLYIAHKDPKHPAWRPTPSPTTDPHWIMDSVKALKEPVGESVVASLATPLTVGALECERALKARGLQAGMKRAGLRRASEGVVQAGARPKCAGKLECSGAPGGEVQVGVQTPPWLPAARSCGCDAGNDGEAVLHGMPYVVRSCVEAESTCRAGGDEEGNTGSSWQHKDKQLQNITFDADGHMGVSGERPLEVSSKRRSMAKPAAGNDAGNGAGANSKQLVPPAAQVAPKGAAVAAGVIEEVLDVYKEWGISKDECVADVVSGFQRSRKRHALAVACVSGRGAHQAVLTLKPAVAGFVRLTLSVYCEPVLVECVPADQLIKSLKDLLWILYNNHVPFNTTLVDYVPANHPQRVFLPRVFDVPPSSPAVDVFGKYYSATVNAKQLIGSLVSAWGATFDYIAETI